MGTPEFAVPTLQKLIDLDYPVVGVVCQPDRPQGRHQILMAPPVKQMAVRNNIPVLQPLKVRTPEFEQQVRALVPDVLVTAAYGRILPANILAVPSQGCLNVHASLLPKYRGAAPVHWSIIQGERETGVTIMLMDIGMDTGDILSQQSLPIPAGMDAETLMNRLAHLGAELLPGTLAGYLAGTVKPVAQDHAQATTIPVLTRETGKIAWQQSAGQIHNLVRGTYPWPGAYTCYGDKRLKIHRSRVSTDPDLIAAGRSNSPGTILVCDEVIGVATGDGVLELLEIQPESGKRMKGRDCAHNYHPGRKMGGET